MGPSNYRTLVSYVGVAVLVMICIGIIILPLTSGNQRIIAAITLIVGLIIFIFLIFTIFDKYIKPIRVATQVADELVRGNYAARTYVNPYGDAGKLSNSINLLARNLQDMTFQEEMHGSQLRTVIDNMESGLMLIDDKGYVQLVNRKFLSLFGKTKSKSIGYLYYEVLEQENIQNSVQEAFLYEEKIKNAITLSLQIEERHLEMVGAPVFNDDKELKGAVLVFHDITELKRLEQTRKDFVANVSHELKTPVTSIRGFAETLLDGAMEDEQLRKQFISIILTESERLQALVHDLLELSKLEEEHLLLRHEKVEMSTLLNDLLPLIQQHAEQKNIIFENIIEGKPTIIGDPDRIKQLFVNLLNNAINYTPRDGTVTLQINTNNNWVVIKVSDTGIGIPREAQPRIFERFFRVDKARSRNTGGTGLGLAIVKHIVEAHEGKIKLESKVDEGTTFKILLPAHTPHGN